MLVLVLYFIFHSVSVVCHPVFLECFLYFQFYRIVSQKSRRIPAHSHDFRFLCLCILGIAMLLWRSVRQLINVSNKTRISILGLMIHFTDHNTLEKFFKLIWQCFILRPLAHMISHKAFLCITVLESLVYGSAL